MKTNRSVTASETNLRERAGFIGWTAALAAAGMVLAVGAATAQVTPGGSVTNIGASASGATQNVSVPSGVGEATAGTLNISGAGTTLNLFDGVNPDAFLRVGNAGTGRVVVNDFGTLNLTASNPASDDALLFLSATPFNSGPSQGGTLVLGDDPTTGAVESTGFMSVAATDDAVVSVGRNGLGDLLMTNSSMNVRSLGANAGAAAVIELGASTVGNAVGSVTATNSNIVVEGQGVAASLVSVGRRTDTVANPNAATAPENTLLLQGGSSLRVIAASNSSFFNVGRDGSRGTTTIDGPFTRLEVEDFVNIGRDGGFGTVNVRNGGSVDNFTVGAANETRLGDGAGSTGTLNINSGGTYETTTLSISHAGGGNGTVNVDGAGSNLNLQGFDNLGRDSRIVVGGTAGGTGNLNVTGGGNVTINTPGVPIATIGGLDVGAIEAGSTGVVNVSGAGSHVNVITGTTHLGFFGNGTINVTGQGTFTDGNRIVIGAEGGIGVLNVNTGGTVNSQRLFMGDDPNTGSQGTVNIDGPAANLNLTGISLADGAGAFFNIGRDIGATATVNVTNGGTLTLDSLGVPPNPAFSGGMSIGGSNTGTGGTGTLNIDSASIVNINTGLSWVGRRGSGTINVRGGSSFTSNDEMIIGDFAGSTGTVNISGAGSSVETGPSSRVGVSGEGNLNVTAGGKFESTEFLTAVGTGSTGNVNVSGPGSTLNLLGVDGQGDAAVAVVGVNGQSVVNISNGGTMNIDANGATVTGLNGGLLIGGSSGSTDQGNGTVNVDGAGSALNIVHSNASMQIGRRGTGVLNITNGGKVTNAAGNALAIVGRTVGAAGTVNITGTGSEWQAGSDLFIGTDVNFGARTAIGNGGAGTVNVANGGRLVADRIVNAALGTITGGGGTIVGDITNAGGTIAAGNSPGLMSVLGNVALLGGGTVEVELGGTVFDSGIPQFDYDRIDVADDVATTGVTEGTVTIDAGAMFDIDFFGAFTAGLGDTFDVIVADEIDVADLSSLLFDFNDAGLMSGLLWEIDIVAFGLGREALRLMVVAE